MNIDMGEHAPLLQNISLAWGGEGDYGNGGMPIVIK